MAKSERTALMRLESYEALLNKSKIFETPEGISMRPRSMEQAESIPRVDLNSMNIE